MADGLRERGRGTGDREDNVTPSLLERSEKGSGNQAFKMSRNFFKRKLFHKPHARQDATEQEPLSQWRLGSLRLRQRAKSSARRPRNANMLIWSGARCAYAYAHKRCLCMNYLTCGTCLQGALVGWTYGDRPGRKPCKFRRTPQVFADSHLHSWKSEHFQVGASRRKAQVFVENGDFAEDCRILQIGMVCLLRSVPMKRGAAVL